MTKFDYSYFRTLGFECSQHRSTPRPSVERIHKKSLHSFGSQKRISRIQSNPLGPGGFECTKHRRNASPVLRGMAIFPFFSLRGLEGGVTLHCESSLRVPRSPLRSRMSYELVPYLTIYMSPPHYVSPPPWELAMSPSLNVAPPLGICRANSLLRVAHLWEFVVTLLVKCRPLFEPA